LQRAGAGPPERTWTLGGIAIDQVSKYKYLGVVYQEDGSWQAHAKGACKDASSLWVLEATAVMQQSADKGQTAHGSDLHLFRSCMAWVTTKAVKDKMSAVVKKSPQHSSPASRDCSSDVLYGDTGLLPPVYSLMLPNCVGSTDQNMEAGRWPKEALRFSFEGSRGVGRPKVGTDWCGNVKSITEQIQHTLI
jgi:hypothetical protein